jgi:hypothetical protein
MASVRHSFYAHLWKTDCAGSRTRDRDARQSCALRQVSILQKKTAQQLVATVCEILQVTAIGSIDEAISRCADSQPIE